MMYTFQPPEISFCAKHAAAAKCKPVMRSSLLRGPQRPGILDHQRAAIDPHVQTTKPLRRKFPPQYHPNQPEALHETQTTKNAVFSTSTPPKPLQNSLLTSRHHRTNDPLDSTPPLHPSVAPRRARPPPASWLSVSGGKMLAEGSRGRRRTRRIRICPCSWHDRSSGVRGLGLVG